MSPSDTGAATPQANTGRRSTRLRLLHLSDLHLGKESAASAWRMRRVLGKAWTDNLKHLADDGPIDLVCFTGDLAQSGQPAQYQQATDFVGQLLELLRVPKERFFCVPGNHDVDRNIEPAAWKELRSAVWDVEAVTFGRYLAAGGRAPRGCDPAWPDQVLARQGAYRAWLKQEGFSHLLPEHGPHGRLGWRATLNLNDLPLHVIGLDSAWLAGDDHDAAKLRLTDEQIARLLTDADGEPLAGHKLALMHHPIGEIADGRTARRLLSEMGVQMLLHGHLHDPELERWSTPAHSAGDALYVSAAGCLYETDAYPNSLQLLDLQLAPEGLQPARLWARRWAGRGHWHNDDALYPGSHAGRLDLLPAAPDGPGVDVTPGAFVGRDDELRQLSQALLPAIQGQTVRPTVVCCAIEGMPGVGKTRLAEQFVRQAWLPAVGLQPLDDPADHVLRLVLSPDSEADAQALGQQLADRLRSNGPPATLWARLADALRHGPGGHQRLLLIENVDGANAAQAVGRLVNALPGCPILVTARWRSLGGSGWQRVSVPPLPLREARALLLAETDSQGSGHRLTTAEADDLALRLGRLPLALHIATSHLSLGLTPGAFLQQLAETGLQLPPADPADPRLTADEARAILHSSFALSWREWTRQHPPGHAWHAAPARLAHGPATPIGLSLAASICELDSSDACSAMAAAAARLSLMELSGGRLQLHPLVAEFLRDQGLTDADGVRQAMGGWFMARLPETGDERQGEAWQAVWNEFDALQAWLAHVPVDEGLQAERAGSRFGISIGPYGAWQSLCERLLVDITDPAIQSNVLFTLAAVASQAGDPDASLIAATRKQQVDRDRGADREAALAAGLAADVLQARGELDEALRIRREEELPVYEKLGDQRSLLVGRANFALLLLRRRVDSDLDEAQSLLWQAHAVAQGLRLPEASQIEQIYQWAFGKPIGLP